MIKIAINGFGRIGRQVFKNIEESHPDLEVVAINDLTDKKTLTHLLQHDSVYGKYEKEIKSDFLKARMFVRIEPREPIYCHVVQRLERTPDKREVMVRFHLWQPI